MSARLPATSVLAFVAFGAVAAMLAVALVGGPGAPPPADDVPRMLPPAPAAAHAVAPPVVAPDLDGDAGPVTPGWDEAFAGAADLFAFARAAGVAALAGDARAQYRLGHALLECETQAARIAQMRQGNAAADAQRYLAAIPAADVRFQAERELRRCARYFDESPLTDLGVPPDARSGNYWLERAVQTGDALAVMDRAVEESLHQHADTVPEAHRVQLLADVRVAFLSREPAALFRIGEVYSRESIARDTLHGAAWMLVACAAGYDCSNANPAVGQGCDAARTCDPRATVATTLERELGPATFAQVAAASREIAALVERGDWPQAQRFLEVNQ